MIGKIALNSFRNFGSKTFEFSDGVTLIIGPNASGKTNILESLFLLSTGKSFKAKTEVEMIRYNESITSITGITGITKLEVKITTGENGWPKKKLLVNGVPRRMVDFAGNFKTVLFGPWDMDLVTASPSLRRKFLDTVLSQTDREYHRSILSYEKGIRQRNRLLFRIREEGVSRSQLSFWNQLLIKNGDYITAKREEFIEFINKMHSLNSQKFQLEYDRSIISEGRLEQYKEEEVAAATTMVGPHRDDMKFTIYNLKFTNKRDLAAYGSRGEQRMGVLWLKIAELDYIEKETRLRQGSGEARPTLLLDDIFSELDHEHRDVVMKLTKNQQTIITTADPHFVKGLKKVEKIELKG
jgi:DNA replication and repair protein RecF